MGDLSQFTALVKYEQPDYEELKRRFQYFVYFVTSDSRGKWFDPIERCKGVSKEKREVAFEYVHLNRVASTDEVLAEMDRRGLRPALYEELLGFAEKYPDERREHPIIALGSWSYLYGDRCVASLEYNRPFAKGRMYRYLVLRLFGITWSGYERFLAVRE